MVYDPEKHHRRSIRIPEYDYSQAGNYFVTVCVNHRELLFGDVIDRKMVLNEYGIIISETWQRLSEQYQYIHLHEWIIMPNHIHGIIEYCADGRGDSRIAPTLTKRKPLGPYYWCFRNGIHKANKQN